LNYRALTTWCVLAVLCFVIASTDRGQTPELQPDTLREMVIRLQVRLDELERDVRVLEIAHADTRQGDEKFWAEHRELQVRVEALERILWICITALTGGMIAVLFRFKRDRMERREGLEAKDEKGK
jgi:hypothetical protein